MAMPLVVGLENVLGVEDVPVRQQEVHSTHSFDQMQDTQVDQMSEFVIPF